MRRVRLVAAGGTLAVAALACYAPVAAQAAAPRAATAAKVAAVSPATVLGHAVNESTAQLDAFWTPARIAAAKPLPMPVVSSAAAARAQAAFQAAATPAVAQETAPATSPAAASAIPAALPGAKSAVWGNHKSFPATTIGKLTFWTGTGTASCTATLVNAPNKDTIWTAAHCVSDGVGHYYTNLIFTPNLVGKKASFGSFKAKYIAAPAGYVRQGLYPYDYAAVALEPNLRGKAQNVAGAMGWIMGGNRFAWPGLHMFGYPGWLYLGGKRYPTDSTQLRYCTGDSKQAQQRQTWKCDMGQGSSGGPLVYRLTSKAGWEVGDISTIDTKGNVYGPQLGAVALATLKLAYKK